MENIKVIYVHLDFSKYSFSSKLEKNSFVCTELPDYASISISQSKKYFAEIVYGIMKAFIKLLVQLKRIIGTVAIENL